MITTPRLLLRPFLSSDFPQYAAANADPTVMRFLGGPIGPEASDRQALGANASLESHGYGKVAIERVSDSAFVGMCGLSREHRYPNDLELGWRLLPQFVGKGYATEAGRAWLDYAFSALGAQRVISIADVPNLRSIAVMERLGMTFDHAAELQDRDERFSAVVFAVANSALK